MADEQSLFGLQNGNGTTDRGTSKMENHQKAQMEEKSERLP
jgi:hypothetical protein